MAMTAVAREDRSVGRVTSSEVRTFYVDVSVTSPLGATHEDQIAVRLNGKVIKRLSHGEAERLGLLR